MDTSIHIHGWGRFMGTGTILGMAASVLFATNVMAASYDTTLAELRQMAQTDPEYVTVMDIGINDQGATIYGVRIEAPTTATDERPHHLVVGAHHGNEQLSVSVAMSFAHKLVASLKDASDPQHVALSASTYFVVPILNISGYNANRREEKSATHGLLDSNRDYPDPCTSDTPFVLASTRSLSEFVAREHIIAAVTIHGYIGTFTYPWGIYTNDARSQDDAAFKVLARQVVTINGYQTGTHKDAIYPTAGAFEDWAYFEHGVWVMLLEIANRPNIDKDARSLLKYFAIAPKTRSMQHEHLGRCTNMPFTIRARP